MAARATCKYCSGPIYKRRQSFARSSGASMGGRSSLNDNAGCFHARAFGSSIYGANNNQRRIFSIFSSYVQNLISTIKYGVVGEHCRYLRRELRSNILMNDGYGSVEYVLYKFFPVRIENRDEGRHPWEHWKASEVSQKLPSTKISRALRWINECFRVTPKIYA